MGDKFWEFKNLSDDEADLLLYGPIASEKPWWDEGDTVTPKQFAEELKNLGEKSNITVRINSDGGDVFAAHAIYTLLKSNSANITVMVDGLAASAATIVAMAGDTIKIPANAMMMIHNPMATMVGYFSSDELEKIAEVLEQVKNSIINAYITKTGLDKKTLSKMMDEETWMTGEEAVEKGFADEVLFQEVQTSLKGSTLIVNSVKHDLSKFKTMPPIGTQAGDIAGFINSTKNKKPQEPASVPQPAGKKEEDEKLDIKTVDDLKQQFPDLVAQVEAAAREEGAKEERQRIQAIDEISQAVSPDLVNRAKYEEPMTAEQLALEALKADAARGRQYLNDLKEDFKESGAEGIEGQPQNLKTGEEQKKEQQSEVAQSIAEFANKRRKK